MNALQDVKLTPRMTEALLAAAKDHNTPNMHGTYKALASRGLVEYVWGRPDCWVITPAGAALATTIREAKQ